MAEQRMRSLVKAISYRLVSSIITGGIFFAVTQKGSVAAAVALFDSIVKTSVFYLHERVWILIGEKHNRQLLVQEESGQAA